MCPARRRAPVTAAADGSFPARPKIASKIPGDCGEVWSTTQRGAAKSAGNPWTITRIASMAPEEPPMTTMRLAATRVSVRQAENGAMAIEIGITELIGTDGNRLGCASTPENDNPEL